MHLGLEGQIAWAGLRSNPRRDITCSRLGWIIEQEVLLYFWCKQRWDVNSCIQYAHLHRAHREHPWVWDNLKQGVDAGDERRFLRWLGLRKLQGKRYEKDLTAVLGHFFVLEAVEERRAKGMSLNKAIALLDGKPPETWEVSDRLRASGEAWSRALVLC